MPTFLLGFDILLLWGCIVESCSKHVDSDDGRGGFKLRLVGLDLWLKLDLLGLIHIVKKG